MNRIEWEYFINHRGKFMTPVDVAATEGSLPINRELKDTSTCGIKPSTF